MRILAIETSCDETAVAILECNGDSTNAVFSILGNALYSQAETHAAYGGVFPMLAKREHARNIVPLLQSALQNAFDQDLAKKSEVTTLDEEMTVKIREILEKENDLAEKLIDACKDMAVPSAAVYLRSGFRPRVKVLPPFSTASVSVPLRMPSQLL